MCVYVHMYRCFAEFTRGVMLSTVSQVKELDFTS